MRSRAGITSLPDTLFVDSNVPMYLIGAAHTNKARSAVLLEGAIAAGERLVTDAEVLQEILHRYGAIDRHDAIQPALDAILGVVDEVYAVEVADVLSAKDILQGSYGLSARDSIHVALMQRHRVTRIMSFDSGFDKYPGLTRIG